MFLLKNKNVPYLYTEHFAVFPWNNNPEVAWHISERINLKVFVRKDPSISWPFSKITSRGRPPKKSYWHPHMVFYVTPREVQYRRPEDVPKLSYSKHQGKSPADVMKTSPYGLRRVLLTSEDVPQRRPEDVFFRRPKDVLVWFYNKG